MTDEFKIQTPFFSFGVVSTPIKLRDGDRILIRYWSWRKFGYIRKLLVVDNGEVKVSILD